MATPKSNRFNLSGQSFGRLTVLMQVGSDERGRLWLCRCVCGNEKTSTTETLRAGIVKSCGCLKRELLTKGIHTIHGNSRHPLFFIWFQMIERCRNPKSHSYKDYGGRGISVCDRWADSFKAFVEDMGPRPEGHCIERVDNSRNYEPSNCRWATRKEESWNTRRNYMIEFRGENRCLAEWSGLTGIPYNTLRARVCKYGWDAEKALTTPIKRR